MEIWDKFGSLMLTIPPSFYPYSPEKLDEGLTIMEKIYSNSGNIELANHIQLTRVSLFTIPKDDDEALKQMKKHLDMIDEHPELKKTLISSLQKTRDQWAKLRDEVKIINR